MGLSANLWPHKTEAPINEQPSIETDETTQGTTQKAAEPKTVFAETNTGTTNQRNMGKGNDEYGKGQLW